MINLASDRSPKIQAQAKIIKPNLRNILIGSMSERSDCILIAAVPVNMRHLHGTNLEPLVTEVAILQYLQQFVPEVKVLNFSRNPDGYFSFKTSIPKSQVQHILNSDIRPVSVAVNLLARRQGPSVAN